MKHLTAIAMATWEAVKTSPEALLIFMPLVAMLLAELYEFYHEQKRKKNSLPKGTGIPKNK